MQILQQKKHISIPSSTKEEPVGIQEGISNSLRLFLKETTFSHKFTNFGCFPDLPKKT